MPYVEPVNIGLEQENPFLIQKEIQKSIFLMKTVLASVHKAQNMSKNAKMIANANVILNGQNFYNLTNSHTLISKVGAMLNKRPNNL